MIEVNESLICCYGADCTDCAVVDCDKVEEAIKDYQEWIPVATKEPDVYRVWMTIQYPLDVVTREGVWYCQEFQWRNGRPVKETVIAWKPRQVPAPYRPEE